MDKYTENEQAKFDYYENEMHKHKQRSLKKLSFISNETDIQDKFAKLLIDAEVEGCIYSEDFISYFDLDDLDKFAILEDLQCFIEEYNAQKESEMDYE
jgi:hypothetical protein